MDTTHPFRLRAYHNPKNYDESRVPAGYRFRYADEMPSPDERSLLFNYNTMQWPPSCWQGTLLGCTYIVPVA